MKPILIIFFLSIAAIGYTQEKLQASLIVNSDMSYEYGKEKVQKIEFVLKPEIIYKFNRKSKLVFKGQIYSELRDNLEPGKTKDVTASNFTKRLFIGDRTNLELRELYYHTRFKNKLSLTIGKQQIVWGETDGLKLLDIVNPQNFREFILDDFEDSRIPLWSVKTDFTIKDIGVQLLWIPDNTYHITQDFNAPYFTKSLFKSAPSGVSIRFNKADKPRDFFKDSDFGLKLTTFKKGWDLSLNYFYYYDDLPVFYNNLTQENTTPIIEISPKYKRQQLIGGTFNKVIGSSTFRGELVYIFNQNFVSNNSNSIQGIEQSNVYKSALGLDYVKGEYVVSTQLFTEWITSSISPYNKDRFESNITLLTSKEMLNDNLKAEILWVHNLNHKDGFITPSLSYWINTNTQLLLNANFFYGSNQFLFGQFTNTNRISVGFKWGI